METIEKSQLDVYIANFSLKFPLLTEKESKKLVEVFRNGKNAQEREGAREKLICSNLKLVVLISRDYDNLGVDKMDLISEGNIGLMTAVERFNPKKSCRFSYYAGLWIRQRMLRALERGARTIRIPNPVVQLKINALKFIEKYEDDFGIKPEDETICKKLKVSKLKLKRALEVSLTTTSLNKLVGGSVGDSSDLLELGCLIEDEHSRPANKIVEKKEIYTILDSILNGLSEREKKIIYLRFGLKNNDKQTLESIGKKYKVTRERIRQVEAIALKKIKKSFEKYSEVKTKV